jgi:hypothetical protein
MDTTTTRRAAPPPARAESRWPPLSRSARRLVLAVHLWSAGAWIGIDVVLAALVVAGVSSDDVARRAVALQALELFAVWPLAAVGLLCLASGVLLGLGTRYGLLRFWWVAAKLVINLVLSTLVLVLLRPNVHRVAEEGRRLAAGEPVGTDLSSLVMPPTVTMVALTVAVYLSVYKPWGRIGGGRSD